MEKKTKDKTKDFALLRLRSTGAIITDGYQLYLDNFRKTFRATWLVAAVYALMLGMFSTFYLNMLADVTILITSHAPMSGIIDVLSSYILIVGGGSLLIYILSLLLFGSGFSLLKVHSQQGNMPTTIRWFGFAEKNTVVRTLSAGMLILLYMLLSGALIGGVTYLLKDYLSATALGLLLLLLQFMAVIILPLLLLLATQHVMGATQKGRQPLRHWGSSIVISLVVCIVIGLLSVVTELPAVVLLFANVSSMSGMLLGDPSGMPDYMSWLNVVVFSLAGFIQAYIYLSSLFPFYYLYGSVEVQEKERAEMNKGNDEPLIKQKS